MIYCVENLCKSIKIKPVYFHDSKPVYILSVNDVTQDLVENDLWNHFDWYLYKTLFLFKNFSVWSWIAFSRAFETAS